MAKIVLEPGKLWALFYLVNGKEMLGGIFVTDYQAHHHAGFLEIKNVEYEVRPINKTELLGLYERYALKKSKKTTK